MENPWKNLNSPNKYGEWVLPGDHDQIREFNSKNRSNPEYQVCLQSLPEPYIGDKSKARVVFLGLNPGHSAADVVHHGRGDFQQAILRNLHERIESFPFYPLNPEFRDTGAGQWWRKRLRKVKDATGLADDALAERIMAIEWFPYHSISSGLPFNVICESQYFSGYLARTMVDAGNVQVIGMKSRARWTEMLGGREIDFLNSSQNSYVTPNNLRPGVFDKIVDILR